MTIKKKQNSPKKIARQSLRSFKAIEEEEEANLRRFHNLQFFLDIRNVLFF